jgi:hypothetical protein
MNFNRTHLLCGLISLQFILLACSSHHEEQGEKPQTFQMPEITTDLAIPSKLWEKISPGEMQAGIVLFAPVSVVLTEKNKGVLKDSSKKVFHFPKGGGELDLAQFINDERRGTFYLNFEFAGFSNIETPKVFFLGQTKKQKIENEILGLGCRTFVEISHALLMQQGKPGLAFNTTDSRHVIAMGGTFIFSFEKDKHIHVAQITFKDSSKENFFCERKLAGQ